jgi:hypothetical protein
MANETVGQSVLDAYLNTIKDTAVEVALVTGWLRTDDYAATQAKVCAQLDVATGDAFWNQTIQDETATGEGDASAPNRRLECTSVVLNNAGAVENTDGTDLSLVIMSGSEVLAVSNETTNRAITTGDSITTYGFYIQVDQPANVAGP